METRRWIRLVALVWRACRSREAIWCFAALVRARFCELLSSKAPKGGSDLFLVGLVLGHGRDPSDPHAEVLEKTVRSGCEVGVDRRTSGPSAFRVPA